MVVTASKLGDGGGMADLEALRQGFGDHLLAAGAPLGQATGLVDRGSIADVACFLRDERGYQLLRSVTAVDFLPAAPRFQVVYHFLALPAHVLEGNPDPRSDATIRQLRVKVPVPGEDPVVPSVVGVYPTADWHECEVWDMFGIEFAGHPGLRRILMPESSEGHPLRKDFPLTYERVAFTFNYDEVRRQKPRAKD